MPADCGVLERIYEELVEKQEKAIEAIDSASDDLISAEMALAGAQASSALCLFAGAPPAIALCAAAAAIAIGTCYAVVAFYKGKLDEAKESLESIIKALEEVAGLMNHCEELASGRQAEADVLAAEAEAAASQAMDPPDSDSSELEDAESAVADLEDLLNSDEPAYG